MNRNDITPQQRIAVNNALTAAAALQAATGVHLPADLVAAQALSASPAH